jgi:SAM-dependent methyltransferase
VNINWKAKSCLLSPFDLLGREALYFTQKRISRRSVIGLATIPRAWTFHQKCIAAYRPSDVIEFGAGKNLGQNIYLSQTGVRQHVVDLNAMLDLSLVNHVIAILRERYALPALPAVSSLEDLRSHYAITYQAPVDMTQSDFDDGAFDMCISSNTLEHIPLATLEAILRELRRILKPRGVISAQIDYSDHYAHTDKTISKLNYLRFSERQWQRHNHKYFFQNRLRHNHYRRLFEAAGFEILSAEALNPTDPLPADLEPSLLTGDDSDFCRLGQWVVRCG